MQVQFRNVYKRYGEVTAVDNLNLTIKSGALHFLLGPSGCGKTTTLRMLAGLEDISSGQIFFDQEDVTKLPASERGIGMVFQNYALWPHMTVQENIEYGLKIKKLSKSEIKKSVDEVVGITQLGPFLARFPGQLSGGQQQRVALARALAIKPRVLLLDEPLSNLDAKLRNDMRENITRIHKQTKITTLYVTHDQKEALSMGTEISLMHKGLLMQSGTPRQLYNLPNSFFVASFIGEANMLHGTYEGITNSHHFVKTDLGTIRCKEAKLNPQKGEKVCVSIRPESLQIADPQNPVVPQADDNKLNLKLSYLTYLGELEQFHFEHTQEQFIKANLSHFPDHNYKEGDILTCFFSPKDALILPPPTDLGPGT